MREFRRSYREGARAASRQKGEGETQCSMHGAAQAPKWVWAGLVSAAFLHRYASNEKLVGVRYK